MNATASIAQLATLSLSAKVVASTVGISPPSSVYTRDSISAASWRLTRSSGRNFPPLPFTMPRALAWSTTGSSVSEKGFSPGAGAVSPLMASYSSTATAANSARVMFTVKSSPRQSAIRPLTAALSTCSLAQSLTLASTVIAK